MILLNLHLLLCISVVKVGKLSMSTGIICESINIKQKKKLDFLTSLRCNHLKLITLALKYHRMASKSRRRHHSIPTHEPNPLLNIFPTCELSMLKKPSWSYFPQESFIISSFCALNPIPVAEGHEFSCYFPRRT
jgi:hypothetical protein